MARGGDEAAADRLASPPPLPEHARHVWNWFADLSATSRPAGAFSIARIPRLEIQAWERDEGVRLQRWERRAILTLDAEFCAAMAPKAKGKGGPSPDKQPVEEV